MFELKPGDAFPFSCPKLDCAGQLIVESVSYVRKRSDDEEDWHSYLTICESCVDRFMWHDFSEEPPTPVSEVWGSAARWTEQRPQVDHSQ